MVLFVYHIALKFRGSLISRISRIWNNLQTFSTKICTLPLYNQRIDSRVYRPRYFKSVDGRYLESKLPDPQGAFSKHVPSSTIFVANNEAAVIQPSAGQESIPQMSVKKAEIGSEQQSMEC